MAAQVAEHAIRFQRLLQMHRDERRGARCSSSRERLRGPRARSPTCCGATVRDAVEKRQRAPSDSVPARFGIHALQPQQPVLEVARQRLDRRAGRQRIEHRRAQPVQPLVGVGLLRPLVEQLGEVADVARAPPTTARSASGDRDASPA